MRDTVVVSNCLIEVLELEYVDDRSEDFFLNNFCCRTDFNNCRLDVIAWAINLFASTKDATALSHNFFQTLLVFAQAVSVVHRAHQGTFSHWVSNFNCCICLYHAGNKSIVDRLMQIDPSKRSTSLAACTHGRKDGSLEGQFKVCIGHD